MEIMQFNSILTNYYVSEYLCTLSTCARRVPTCRLPVDNTLPGAILSPPGSINILYLLNVGG